MHYLLQHETIAILNISFVCKKSFSLYHENVYLCAYSGKGFFRERNLILSIKSGNFCKISYPLFFIIDFIINELVKF